MVFTLNVFGCGELEGGLPSMLWKNGVVTRAGMSSPVVAFGGIDGACALCGSSGTEFGTLFFGPEGTGAGGTLGGISVMVGHNRSINVINSGNTNGSALLGVVANITFPSRNRVAISNGITTLLRLATNFSVRVANERGVCLGNCILNLRSDCVGRVRRGVVSFTRLKSCVSRPMEACSDNVGVHLNFTVGIGVRPSILIISRTLSINSTAFGGGYGGGVGRVVRDNMAMLCMDRGTTSIGRVYTHSVFLGGKAIVFSKPASRALEICRRSGGGGWFHFKVGRGLRGYKTFLVCLENGPV